ncbi:MAG TPA: SRPBCC family protein [Anaerolineales bacterium]
MALRFETTEVIDRPIEKVFHFYAVDHVRNHPRWDPDMELWLEGDAPIGVGTIIRRRNRRSGKPVEGTMQVLEFEPNKAFSMLIHDGPAEMRGRSTFEAVGDHQTRITTVIDIPGMDENADRSFLNAKLERSARIRKQLMEAEL